MIHRVEPGMGLDICLLENKPAVSFDDSSSSSKTKLEKREMSNRLTTIIIRRSPSQTICGGIPGRQIYKGFIVTIRQKFKESDKAEITGSTRYSNTGGVRNYSLKIFNWLPDLREVHIPITDDLLSIKFLTFCVLTMSI